MIEKENKGPIYLPIIRHTIAWCTSIACESISTPYTAHWVRASVAFFKLSEGKYALSVIGSFPLRFRCFEFDPLAFFLPAEVLDTLPVAVVLDGSAAVADEAL